MTAPLAILPPVTYRNGVLSCGPARLVLASCNQKLGHVDLVENTTPRLRPVARRPFVACTYLPIRQTCPDSCVFKSGGCLAAEGFTKFRIAQSEALADELGLNADDIIACEAALIAGAHDRVGRRKLRRRDLRLHVSGDATTPAQATVLGRAATVWHVKGGGAVWTYTHSWREILRSAWGPHISVLASVEKATDAAEARRAGYAPAIVVRDFPNGERAWDNNGTRWVPCPAETRGMACIDCRLCFGTSKLERIGIAFEAHGRGRNRASRHLPVMVAP